MIKDQRPQENTERVYLPRRGYILVVAKGYFGVVDATSCALIFARPQVIKSGFPQTRGGGLKELR